MSKQFAGRVGFDLSERKIKSFFQSVLSYARSNNLVLALGHDGSEWAQTYYDEVILPFCEETGISIITPQTAAPLPAFAWFVKSGQKKAIGAYISCFSGGFGDIGVQILDERGEYADPPVQAAGKPVQSCHQLADTYDLDRYVEYLKEHHKVPASALLGKVIGMDLMFGSSEMVVPQLKSEFKIAPKLFNLQSNAYRPRGYSSIPTGKALAWQTGNPIVKTCQYFVAFNYEGTRLGLWDLKQNQEISQSGVALLLLLHLKSFGDAGANTVFVSPMLSDRLTEAGRKLNLNVKVVNDSYRFLQEHRADFNLAILGEGRFFPDPQHLIENPYLLLFRLIQLCETYDKSPGELLDEMKEKYYGKDYFYSYLFFENSKDRVKKLKETLKKLALRRGAVWKSGLNLLSFDGSGKIAYLENKPRKIITVFIESTSQEILTELNENFKELLYD